MPKQIKPRPKKYDYDKTWYSWYDMWRRVDGKIRSNMAPCTADPRWREYQVFLDEMGKQPNGKSLDKDIRVLGNRHYSKEMCMWATREQQANARNCTTYVEHENKSVPLKPLFRSVQSAVGIDTVRARLKKGVSFKDAITAKPFSNIGKACLGLRSGRLVVVEDLGTIWVCKSYARQVSCLCDCGNYKTLLLRTIASQLTKSCGCLRKKIIN